MHKAEARRGGSKDLEDFPVPAQRRGSRTTEERKPKMIISFFSPEKIEVNAHSQYQKQSLSISDFLSPQRRKAG
jgi:hypothetical protein